jgi:hypothetical protein
MEVLKLNGEMVKIDIEDNLDEIFDLIEDEAVELGYIIGEEDE